MTRSKPVIPALVVALVVGASAAATLAKGQRFGEEVSRFSYSSL